MSVQGMHILTRLSSTSILLLGQALTQELWSTTKLSGKHFTINVKYSLSAVCHTGTSGKISGTWCKKLEKCYFVTFIHQHAPKLQHRMNHSCLDWSIYKWKSFIFNDSWFEEMQRQLQLRDSANWPYREDVFSSLVLVSLMEAASSVITFPACHCPHWYVCKVFPHPCHISTVAKIPI